MPGKGVVANELRPYLPEPVVYALVRVAKVLFAMGTYKFARAYPERARAILMKQVEKQLGGAVDMKHFSPKYAVWDERLCAVPDGDMFEVLRDGRASPGIGRNPVAPRRALREALRFHAIHHPAEVPS